MNVKIVINAKNTNKEDIRSFVQLIREWELRTPKANIVGVLFETDPEITSKEAKKIFEGIFPEFEHLVEVPGSPELLLAHQPMLLRLGSRAIVLQGKLMGTCDELTLSIGEASDEEMKALQDAEIISLARMNKG